MDMLIPFHWIYHFFLDFYFTALLFILQNISRQACSVLCACSSKLQPVVSIVMPVTATKSVKVFAAAAYKEPIRTLIMAKSWSDHVASVHLGQLIWDMTDIKHMRFDYVVPVPLHWTRFAKRGFNQAQEIDKYWQKKVEHVALMH